MPPKPRSLSRVSLKIKFSWKNTFQGEMLRFMMTPEALYKKLKTCIPNFKKCHIDSRLIEPGDLFFALSGAKVDGHSFLEQVMEKGALGAVVQKGKSSGSNCFEVEDPFLALQEMGKGRCLTLQKKNLVGITGSLGKTTTKEWMHHLSQGGISAAFSPKSYNSQRTVPLNLLNFPEQAQWWVLEMGMSEPGNLERLIDLAPPKIALITTISWQHVTLFEKGLEGIAEEKSTLFAHPNTQWGLYYKEAPFADVLKNRGQCQKLSFSLKDPKSDFYLESIEENRVAIHHQGKRYLFDFSVEVPAHRLNFLAAVATLVTMGEVWDVMQKNSSTLKLPRMRFEMVVKKGIHFINDAYNANPEAIVGALGALPKPKGQGRRIGVLTEMDDLGLYAQEGHRQVGEESLKRLDALFCLGENCRIMEAQWKKEERPVFFSRTFEELKEMLQSFLREDDVVLLKGARIYALERLLDGDFS
jgi:UDP-N-acetylmuramoyl-tripeptide--D-alanyl-D-alanine ligase